MSYVNRFTTLQLRVAAQEHRQPHHFGGGRIFGRQKRTWVAAAWVAMHIVKR